MFGNLYKLDINDKIYVTDQEGKSLEYNIYNIFKTSAKDINCILNSKEKELTLITCTITGLERLIIKARSI